MAEQVYCGQNGETFIPHNEASFTDAMNKIWNSGNRLESRRKIQLEARERFSQESWLQKRIRLYQSLLS